MDKRSQNIPPKNWRQRGQLTIFLAIAIMSIITLIAFVVNVGLFVKAKINFQNSVDAAAWSGAAVQSRQLTDIAYLNWEMRNVYKEWMFKYYVLGSLSLTHTHTNSPNFNTRNLGNMNFRMQRFNTTNQNADLFDLYNIPTVCIHYNSTFNICEVYDVPGIPRFPNLNIAGIDNEQRQFVNAVSTTKAQDCVKRTNMNFGTAIEWIYGTGNGVLMGGSPEVASNRIGAWTSAIELALRMRNLEMIVNRPPIEDGICLLSSLCNTVVSDLSNQILPVNERPVKAFWSALKSLGGAKYQGSDSELKTNFVLYEVATDEGSVDFTGSDSLSTYLIPADSASKVGFDASVKYYVDLQIIPLNLVNFFTTFVPTTGSIDNGNVITEAQCTGSKTAIPVPGYIFGFVKNPEIMTYYAVKAKTKYVGLFFPFTERAGIEFQGYAAAKPFGGRIGPDLFAIEGNQRILPKDNQGGDQNKSLPYVSGLNVSLLTGADFVAGWPIPATEDFWVVDKNSILGGVPKSGQDVTFAIPNMVYDIAGPMTKHTVNGASQLQTLPSANDKGEAYGSVKEEAGLYSKEQFKNFSRSITPYVSSLNAQVVSTAIEQSRRPTLYDALNYLIPTVKDNNKSDYDTVDRVNASYNSTSKSYHYNLFAPLFDNGSLYVNVADVTTVIEEYIEANKDAIKIYLEALHKVAQSIRNLTVTDPNGNLLTDYDPAANSVHDGGNIGGATVPTCASIAGKFESFFMGDLANMSSPCAKTLSQNLKEYWNDKKTDASFNLYYKTSYSVPIDPASGSKLPNSRIMTAYMPGKLQGATSSGYLIHPITGAQTLSKRNYYSTKFIPIARIMANPSAQGYAPYTGSSYSTIQDTSSGELVVGQGSGSMKTFENTIPNSKLNEFKYLFH